MKHFSGFFLLTFSLQSYLSTHEARKMEWLKVLQRSSQDIQIALQNLEKTLDSKQNM